MVFGTPSGSSFGTPPLFGASPSPLFAYPSDSQPPGRTSAFGAPSSPAYGSPSPPSMFGSSSSPAAFETTTSAFQNCAWGGFPSTTGPPSSSFSSPFHKPNPSSGAERVTFRFPPVKEQPRSGSPVDNATRSNFDRISVTAEKAAILRNIKRKHPSCLSSLRLQSGYHRLSAYDHLVKVIEELKAIGGKGGPDSYDRVLIWLADLEIYGFDMGWLREEVVKLRRRSLEVLTEKEAKWKAREELVKQIEAIDAELAVENDADAPDFLTDLFNA